jgi:hypothetical protein
MNSTPRNPFILAPRPMKRSTLNQCSKIAYKDKENQNIKNSPKIFQKKVSKLSFSNMNTKNPFSLVKNEKEESEKILCLIKMNSEPLEKSSCISEQGNRPKKENSSFVEEEVSFQDFKSELKKFREEMEAKDEILSILSTESSLVVRKDIRSSMPPLRPQNPLLKFFLDAAEKSIENCCIEKKNNLDLGLKEDKGKSRSTTPNRLSSDIYTCK